MIRRFALLITGATALLAGSAPAQVRPIPADRLRMLDLPQLEIVDVRRFADDSSTIRARDSIPVEVIVRNTGRRSAMVRAGTPNSRAGRRGQALMRYGPVRTIGPGGTVSLPLMLEATTFEGGRFQATVFLFHPPAADDPPVGRLFKDNDQTNNEFKVSFAYVPDKTWSVQATLHRLYIYDDCDNVSDGDWNVHFALAEMKNNVVVQKKEVYWPGKNTARDVESRTTVGIDKALQMVVSPESQLLLSVTAIDCDADSPFSWPITAAAANITEKPVPVSTGPVQAYFIMSGGCGGEEIWEASGNHDRAGSYTYLLEPAFWQHGDLRDLRHTGYEHHTCNDSPSPAYRPNVRLRAVVSPNHIWTTP